MQCRRCGKDLGNSLRCTFCGYENTEGNVREMTRTEKTFFNGVTIDAGSAESTGSAGARNDETFRSQRRNYDYSTRGTYVSFGGSNIFTRALGSFVRALLNGSRLAQIAMVLIGIAFGALMFFVALPILFVLLAIGLALLALARFTR